jgi:hypothetical protein
MRIPALVQSHVLAAIKRIDREGVSPRRESTRYVLLYEGRHYPPKYVLSLAAEEATGQALNPQDFSGGRETNDILRDLGFEIFVTDPRAVEAVAPTGSQERLVIARVVLRHAKLTPTVAAARLHEVLARWPNGARARFLVTPGGFVRYPFPDPWDGETGWRSRPEDLDALVVHAQAALSNVLTPRVLSAATGKVDVLTIGIDLNDDEHAERAELVASHEVASGRTCWTGKSYPVPSQERSLVQVTQLDTHLQPLAGERVLVLGCHDLNMFSPRGWAGQRRGGLRRQRCAAMRTLARDFKPTVVLHHPHQTDSPNIWRGAWTGLRAALPTVEAWASGINYRNDGRKCRAPLAKVLEATQGGSSRLDLR